jgi:hypothetical protein
MKVHVAHVAHVFSGEVNQKERQKMKQTPEQWDALVGRLNGGSCPVLPNHGYKVAPVGLAVEPIPGMNFSRIFDLKEGGSGYAIEVTLRNDANRPIDIVGFRIRTPWGIPKLTLLRPPNYAFREPGPSYDADFVINRYFQKRKSRLLPNKETEGLLIASSEDEIAEGVQHFDSVFLTLDVFDSRSNVFSGHFGVRVDRRERIARELRNQKSRSARPKSVPKPEELHEVCV